MPHAGTADRHPTRLGPVRLAVRDRDRAGAFYTEAIGLAPLPDSGDGAARLGAAGTPIVELEEDGAASPAPRGTAGLFHLAVLVPDRRALADALTRSLRAGAKLTGAADHLVSEALYLDDPEGNGIEIYRDRPREEWPHRGGVLQMDTLPFDIDALLAERTPGGTPTGVPDATILGHIHLRVDSLPGARAFYAGVLGLQVTVETYPGALFLAADGYHHHVGLNTWMSNRPAPAGALGLRHYELIVPAHVLEGIARGSGAERSPAGALDLSDPAGNRVRLIAA